MPIRSCVTPISAVAGARVTTIEGLSTDGSHPVQRAWEETDVAQCGYCQAGQIMSAAALLAKTPKPTDAQIDAAMTGNLCRCATYLRIRAGDPQAASRKRRPPPVSQVRALRSHRGKHIDGSPHLPARRRLAGGGLFVAVYSLDAATERADIDRARCGRTTSRRTRSFASRRPARSRSSRRIPRRGRE